MNYVLEKALGSPESFRERFQTLRLANVERAMTNMLSIVSMRIPAELFDNLVSQLEREIPAVSDPDMALNNLERYFAASRNPLALASLFERDPSAIPVLLKIFSTSQYLTDQLIRDPSSYDALRLAAGQPVSREILVDELDLALSVIASDDVHSAMGIIRRFKHRETLRIAFGDIIGDQTLETVAGQISHLADAICTGGLKFAKRKLQEKHGHPKSRSGTPSTLAAIAMGKLGGGELNYSSDIDLVFFYQSDGETDGNRTLSNRDFFERWIRQFVKLLTEPTALGNVYRVDLRLRPHGSKAPLCCSIQQAISYYDMQGRTWERQALVKARPVAGDLKLGTQILKQLETWIYARRLSISQISGIKALKRQIERRVKQDGDEKTNVKTGRGGIRDIEFAIQFMQLLHGTETNSVRTGNTLEAIDRLYQAGCINSQERSLLDSGYRWLRRVEHRLQIMFDLQTHKLPESPLELVRVARRTGIDGADEQATLRQFQEKLNQVTHHNRVILDHLLHNAFTGSGNTEFSRESDLILDPTLPESDVVEILSGYHFNNELAAQRNLLLLAKERNRFLKPLRCLHFLAAIAKPLLTEISNTPAPDRTLLNLVKVSDSLGGKAAIWELFTSQPAFLKLYVRLCASCEYLCNILTRNPGMIDELMDALVLQSLPSGDQSSSMLNDLLAGAENIDPIIHSFKDAQHLRVGIRDISRLDDIADTHRALADVAETCLKQIILKEYEELTRKLGQPVDDADRPVPIQTIALGKLGGQEPNYHSDMDLVFLYQSGQGDSTRFRQPSRRCTSHQDFFSRLAANITKRISSPGLHGRLYEVDNRLRPTGKSGSLAVSTNEFARYFRDGSGQLWERLALCKARPILVTDDGAENIRTLIFECITARSWSPSFAEEVASMRLRMQEGANVRNIKRGPGGTVDIEFIVQMLQLKHAVEFPEVLLPNTVIAAHALHKNSLLSKSDFEFFCKSYQMLRWVEARLRLMNTDARHDVPGTDAGFSNLAMLLGYPDHQQLRSEIEYLRRENRRRFTCLVEAHGV